LLCAQQLSVKGRRVDLLPPTSLQVARGELLLVTGDRQDQRTALALVLSGRMKTDGGALNWDGSAGARPLRRASALVDSPGVNEPEQHLSVADLVTEDLALIPRRYRGALLSKPWLKVNRFEDVAGMWVEQLPPGRRTELLTALALANPGTDLLVLDSPDRHGADPAGWLPRLTELANDGGRPLAVVATVGALPDGWTGPSAVIGNAAPRPSAPSDASEPTNASEPTDASEPTEESFCADNGRKTPPKSDYLDENSSLMQEEAK